MFFRAALLCVASLFAACGRKQKTVMNFAVPRAALCARMQLPAPYAISLKEWVLSWRHVAEVPLPGITLIAYQIYVVNDRGIVVREPVVRVPANQCKWAVPGACRSNNWYLVRAIFEKNGQEIQGPCSAMAQVKRENS